MLTIWLCVALFCNAFHPVPELCCKSWWHLRIGIDSYSTKPYWTKSEHLYWGLLLLLNHWFSQGPFWSTWEPIDIGHLWNREYLMLSNWWWSRCRRGPVKLFHLGWWWRSRDCHWEAWSHRGKRALSMAT